MRFSFTKVTPPVEVIGKSEIYEDWGNLQPHPGNMAQHNLDTKITLNGGILTDILRMVSP